MAHRPLALVVLLAAAVCNAADFRVVAGDAEAGFRDGTGSAARFREPIRLAAFDDDSVLVADIFNHSIRKVTRDGRVTTIAGGPKPGHRDGPAKQALFDSPHGVSVSPAGVIAVGEATNNTVRLITPAKDAKGDWVVTTLAGTPGVSGMRDGPVAQALFSSPHAVAWQDDGSLLVLDIGNARIRRIADGVVSTVAGSAARGRADGAPLEASFIAPIDMTVAPDDSIYIADAGSGRIARWSADGGVRTLTANAALDKPHGVAVGADGVVYVAEIGAHRVVTLTPDGAVTRIAGTGVAGNGPSELNRPAALLIHSGLLWIADLENNRILAITAAPAAPPQSLSPP